MGNNWDMGRQTSDIKNRTLNIPHQILDKISDIGQHSSKIGHQTLDVENGT